MRTAQLDCLPNHTIREDGQLFNYRIGIVPKTYTSSAGNFDCLEYQGKRHWVHRLVAEAFIPNPDRHKYVLHKDGNKRNNHYSNLYWSSTTYRDGSHKLRHGGPKAAIAAVDDEGNVIHVCIGYDQAIAKGFSRSGINQSIRHNCRHKGLYWRYARADELIERGLYEPGLRLHR